MPWVGPETLDPRIHSQIGRIYGDDIWEQLGARWSRVIGIDPQARLTRWYQTPEEIAREWHKNVNAAWYTLHALGLAVDVTPTTRAARARMIEAGRRQGFVVRTYETDPHLHFEWPRAPGIDELVRRVMGARPARRRGR